MFSGTAFSTSKFVFLRNNDKTFPHLKFLKQDLHRISNSSFENWGISLELGNITRIFPNFGWGILCHVTRFDQSRARERKYLMDYKLKYSNVSIPHCRED